MPRLVGTAAHAPGGARYESVVQRIPSSFGPGAQRVEAVQPLGEVVTSVAEPDRREARRISLASIDRRRCAAPVHVIGDFGENAVRSSAAMLANFPRMFRPVKQAARQHGQAIEQLQRENPPPQPVEDVAILRRPSNAGTHAIEMAPRAISAARRAAITTAALPRPPRRRRTGHPAGAHG